MTTRTAGPRSGCPINAAVEVIGDRWSLLVLRDAMFGNRRHFRALEELSEESIASNILADRLRRLRDTGLLTRADVSRGRRAIYSLTEAAIELVPVMAALGGWELRNRPTSPTLRVRAKLLADGGPGLWEDFMAELRAEHLGAEPPPHDRPRATELPSRAPPPTDSHTRWTNNRGPVTRICAALAERLLARRASVEIQRATCASRACRPQRIAARIWRWSARCSIATDVVPQSRHRQRPHVRVDCHAR